MAALRGFAGAFKVSVGDVKLGLSEQVRAEAPIWRWIYRIY